MKRILPIILLLICLLPFTVATGTTDPPPPDSLEGESSQPVTLILDGVTLNLRTPFLPAESFLATEPDDPVQVASAVDFGEIFKLISIIAVPYGTKPGAEGLPTAQPHSAEAYREQLAQHRRIQGGRPRSGPVATLFGQQVTGSASTVEIYVSVFAPQPVHIIEWVVEAGSRLWIVRISQAAMPPADSAPLSAQEEQFSAQLTDKDAEAVANPARFADLGRSKKQMAMQDYERKMGAAFREMHRLLRDDGVLTVMFTHKKVEAWDTLATALINAGFTITASWPVHTESEHSLHQAKKNAARSTILLACRKRVDKETRGQGDRGTGRPGDRETDSLSPPPLVSPSPVWWDDIQPRVRQVAREKAAEFAERGIGGVDLYLSTFGPVLSVISQHWPVLTSEVDERTGQPKPLRPETALDLAREEVIRLRKRGLLLGREVQFDPTTDWYLMAWDAFKAERFPADEARKLALALGLDVERDLVRRRVVSKKGSDVILLLPKQRRGRGKADPDAEHFDTWLDAVHTAMLVYAEDGAPACEAFLKRAGLRSDGTFKACLQAMFNAVPRMQIKGQFVRPEAEVLDRLRLAFFEELEAPVEDEAERTEQLKLEM